MASEQDLKYMQEALTIAESMRGRTNPDPMVGAVIVKDGEVVSRGYHAELATPHAEVYAIEKAHGNTQGATIYVSLEPCCHWGNNPPCTDSIIRAGIKRVVIAMKDPNPLVKACDSLKILKAAGIEVETGVLEKEALKLNEVFVKYITKNKPFVMLKMAVSLDGRIATRTGDSHWITSLDSRQYVHRLRSEVDAVMVGVNTVLSDDPFLTVRDQGAIKRPVKDNPHRVILDTMARTPLEANVIKEISAESRTIIAVSSRANADKIKQLKEKGAEILYVPEISEGKLNLRILLNELGEKKICYLMVEGGATVAASMLEADLVDKVFWFISPKIIGGTEAIPAVKGQGAADVATAVKLQEVKVEQLGEDVLIRGYIHLPW
ncbi:MAG: bifunctional diaminohydroxyphosphoribosylaminopyrimidine deaminase/5-amino-6-(5-phosphoribosylamino)uracil reductase RibD [Candidatus Margulisiibacteriota bacterium]|jgi:diaminohydroxyphosphoribosylaminopyrimidine deaminase/5-amino-6-(5-phosphoribosylamino)uracil reductase